MIFTALAELSTRQIAETMNAVGMDENKVAGKKGGGIAKKARRELEAKTGKKVGFMRKSAILRNIRPCCIRREKNWSAGNPPYIWAVSIK